MKTKIFLFLIGCLLFAACSEDFITRDNDKSRYTPGTFYITKDRADQALNAAYSGLNEWGSGYTWFLGLMHYVLGDDLYETGYAAGFAPWGSTTNFYISNTDANVNDTWNGYYSNILLINNALEVMPEAQQIAVESDPAFSQEVLDVMMGQAYFLRAFMYYNIAQYFGDENVIIRKTTPKSDAELIMPPASAEETFAFIVEDLKMAQDLLKNALNTTNGYAPGRATRGAATALLGKWYINHEMYAEAAAEFKKILPEVGDAAYGVYSLVPNYRDNFTKENQHNSESIFEINFEDINSSAGWSNNDVHWLIQNFTTNRTTNPDMWWNFTVPAFKLNSFENWTENIDGTPTTVYDYRVYETFWGVPNGANFTYKGDEKDWEEQGWDEENIIGQEGAYGIRKYAYDDTEEMGFSPQWNDVNLRIIRLADIMLLYAECLAQTNGNASLTDPNSALYWIQKVRDRANNVADDQDHLYSTREGVRGQLPDAKTLMDSKGWTLMQLIQHERNVEGYCEGWRKEDMKRWKVGADFVKFKPGWQGYQSLILPVPKNETDRNPNF